MYNLYIGSNNHTGKLEIERLTKEVAERFESFTIIRATGYWKGTAEDTAIVQIQSDNEFQIEALIVRLKFILNQQAIGLSITPDLILK